MKPETSHYKKKLEAERDLLLNELQDLGKENPENDDWEAMPIIEEVDVDMADENERADQFEDFEERSSTLNILEERLQNIKTALTRIEDGTYGKCVIDNGPIEPARLEANPAALTCKIHINSI